MVCHYKKFFNDRFDAFLFEESDFEAVKQTIEEFSPMEIAREMRIPLSHILYVGISDTYEEYCDLVDNQMKKEGLSSKVLTP